MKLTRRDFAAGLAVGVAVPYVIGSAARAQGATIKIGMCAPITGPAAEAGKYATGGAKLAVEAVNKAGGVLGKQLELIVEDDQTTNPASCWRSRNWHRNPISSVSSARSARRRCMPCSPTS